jgi:ubiquinone/menaquinone biosynthesis C-methylase UbiE
MAAARLLGPEGRAFATEIDPDKLDGIRRKARKLRLSNVTVVQGEDGRSGLPSNSCDAILLRGSYHHITDPPAMLADLYHVLRSDGVIVIVDFPPRRWLSLIAPVKGVPANRGGHGIPMNVVIREMTAAGFEVKKKMSRWFIDVYCVVFRKPVAV